MTALWTVFWLATQCVALVVAAALLLCAPPLALLAAARSWGRALRLVHAYHDARRPLPEADPDAASAAYDRGARLARAIAVLAPRAAVEAAFREATFARLGGQAAAGRVSREWADAYYARVEAAGAADYYDRLADAYRRVYTLDELEALADAERRVRDAQAQRDDLEMRREEARIEVDRRVRRDLALGRDGSSPGRAPRPRPDRPRPDRDRDRPDRPGRDEAAPAAHPAFARPPAAAPAAAAP